MNALKLYWNQKRQESIATIIALLASSIVILVPAIWYQHPLVVFTAWMLTSSGFVGHALMMVIVHNQQHKANQRSVLSKLPGLTHLLSMLLVMAIVRVGAADYTGPPTATPSPETVPPFETNVSIQLLTTNQPGDPQAIIPAAVCVGVGVGIIGWIGIKLWSACVNMQIRNLTNKAAVNIQAAAAPITSPPEIPSTSNPVTGSGCQCQPPHTVSPLPLLLEHSHDGQSWSPVSAGMTTGERIFVPDTGTWRITPMKIVATIDGMIVPPGTLETSTDLKEWAVVSVSASGRTVTPEPNHFYRIR